jgi:NAD(P)-dependent dehydrogenase (short-subunit alcohol dehydrogenase family)
MSKVRGKFAIVTGGSRGIGFAGAKALVEHGCSVFIASRSRDEVAAAVERLREYCNAGAKAAGSACDVRRSSQVAAMVDQAVKEFGGLDILINNAGYWSHSRVAEMSIDDWVATIETNLSGVFYCCRAAIPHLKKAGGGYIINIGSLAGKNAFPGGSAYNASKFGLIGFSEALMQEVRYDHIRVTCLMPGSVNTGFGRGEAEDPAGTWKLWPEDVAEVIVSLLEMDRRALASSVDLRPSEPKK